MDVEGQAMNTLSTKVSSEMESILDEIESNAAIKSVVFASGKDGSFMAGADIDMLSSVNSAQRPTTSRLLGRSHVNVWKTSIGTSVSQLSLLLTVLLSVADLKLRWLVVTESSVTTRRLFWGYLRLNWGCCRVPAVRSVYRS